jgi:hypothetical protein
MLALLLVLLLVALRFGLGFAVTWLFIVAAVLALVWLVGSLCQGRGGDLVPLVTSGSADQAARASLSA